MIQKFKNIFNLKRLRTFKLGGYYLKFISRKLYISPSLRQLGVHENAINKGYLFYKTLFDEFEINGKSLILDIGANIGYSSISFAKASPESTIFAFEPDRVNKFCFGFNIRNFPRIYLLPFGCSETVGELKFGIPSFADDYQDPDRRKNTGLITAVKSKLKGNPLHSNIVVSLNSLDPIFSEMNQIFFAKIDVEGFEYQVIKGGKKIFEDRALLEMEFNDKYESEFSFQDIMQVCEDNDYISTVRSESYLQMQASERKIFDLILLPKEKSTIPKLEKVGLNEINFRDNLI